jgi:hypothetical protein
LIKREAYQSAGGLNSNFKLAFDFDLLLRLKGEGRFIFIDQPLAQFRWHPNSLSVRVRLLSALDASRARRSQHSLPVKMMSFFWEPLIILATWGAGKLVNIYSGVRR